MNGILKGITSISNLLDHGRWPYPNIPTQQMLWILTLVCMQFMGDYWSWHIRPDYTADFAQGLDEGIHKIFQLCIGIDINLWIDFAKERMQLPIRFKGLGLRESCGRCHAQHIRALTQSIPYLIDQTDGNNIIQWRLNIQSIGNHLGEDSFNSTSQPPWENLLNAEVPEPTATLQMDYDMPERIYKTTSKPLLHQHNLLLTPPKTYTHKISQEQDLTMTDLHPSRSPTQLPWN